jgi:hypothetical protein
VESGLDTAEQVALNPRRYLDQVQLPEITAEETQRVVRRGPVVKPTVEEAGGVSESQTGG